MAHEPIPPSPGGTPADRTVQSPKQLFEYLLRRLSGGAPPANSRGVEEVGGERVGRVSEKTGDGPEQTVAAVDRRVPDQPCDLQANGLSGSEDTSATTTTTITTTAAAAAAATGGRSPSGGPGRSASERTELSMSVQVPVREVPREGAGAGDSLRYEIGGQGVESPPSDGVQGGVRPSRHMQLAECGEISEWDGDVEGPFHDVVLAVQRGLYCDSGDTYQLEAGLVLDAKKRVGVKEGGAGSALGVEFEQQDGCVLIRPRSWKEGVLARLAAGGRHSSTMGRSGKS
jgi:hypothetical protein